MAGGSMVPLMVGVTLCGVTGLLIYLLWRKEDERVECSNNRTKELRLPANVVPALIGRGGSNIKVLQEKSGARIIFIDSVPGKTERKGQGERVCLLQGQLECIRVAEMLIQEIIAAQVPPQETVINVPAWAAGKIIGRGGETIRDICLTSGAKVKLEDCEGDLLAPTQKKVTISGSPEQITVAQNIIEKYVNMERKRRDEESIRREPRGHYADSRKQESQDKEKVASGGAEDIGSGSTLLEVFVSAVSSPSRFWLQMVGPQVQQLDRLVDDMTLYYSSSQNRELHKIPEIEVGQVVAAVFRHDGKWYRAKVAEIKPNEYDGRQRVCDVHFVDYGDNEYVACEELLALRTDMLQLRFQAVECFLAGVEPVPPPQHAPGQALKWNPKAIERFEELTQVARWKRLWSRTCAFKERPQPVSEHGQGDARNVREGSPVPGVKLYDFKDGTDVDIGGVLVEEGWAVPVDEQGTPPPLTIPPPTFGDLQSSRVLGMVVGPEKREERAISLPHGGVSPRDSPVPAHKEQGDGVLSTDTKPKSTSLAAGMDNNKLKSAPGGFADLSYPKPEPKDTTQINGTPVAVNGTNNHNGAFINAERQVATTPTAIEHPSTPTREGLRRNADSFGKSLPFHTPDPKDELKAKMNRVDSHHGNLQDLEKSAPPVISSVNTPK